MEHWCQRLECQLAYKCQASNPAHRVVSLRLRILPTDVDLLTTIPAELSSKRALDNFHITVTDSRLCFKLLSWSHQIRQPMTTTPKQGDDASRDSGAIRFSRQ